MYNVDRALRAAEREGFLRVPTRDQSLTVVSRWWQRCEIFDRPWVVLFGTQGKTRYLKIDTATKRSVRGLTPDAVDQLVRLTRWTCHDAPRVVFWTGPEHLTFDRLPPEHGEYLAAEIARLLTFPDMYDSHSTRQRSSKPGIVSLDAERRRRRQLTGMV